MTAVLTATLDLERGMRGIGIYVWRRAARGCSRRGDLSGRKLVDSGRKLRGRCNARMCQAIGRFAHVHRECVWLDDLFLKCVWGGGFVRMWVFSSAYRGRPNTGVVAENVVDWTVRY